ncbi:hypothetical protein QA635_06440 [Bradyrhizobium brasilense]|nr:hypothetical protein [Bradyrhizobium australafricanum]WFU34074.1 hypothetical protein QA635_06440 [Bradyrhizobium australafricanum]
MPKSAATTKAPNAEVAPNVLGKIAEVGLRLWLRCGHDRDRRVTT